MDTSEKYNFSDFTRSNYRKLLRIAKEKYEFCNFENYESSSNFIIWRHDVDFSVHSSHALAVIEKEENVQSTFFIHLHNEFYNVFEKEITELLKKIFEMGHNPGLHFDCHFYGITDQRALEEKLAFEKEILEKLLNVPVNAFSFHNTTEEILLYDNNDYAGMINTYSKFFRKDTGYCSDSNGYWRYERLEDVLSSGKYPRLQVLTHPAWWQEEVFSPRQRIWRCIEGRAEKTKQKYNDTLSSMGRENIK
jgi:hypothetical protein